MKFHQPGALAGYELTFITKNELTDDGLQGLHQKLNDIVANFGGEVILTEDWGKRKLAYAIEKETRGHYSYQVFTGKAGVVQEMERNLRLHDHVMRFLTVSLDAEFDAVLYRKHRLDARAAAKKREEEREARREERREEREARRGGHSDDRPSRAPAPAPEPAAVAVPAQVSTESSTV